MHWGWLTRRRGAAGHLPPAIGRADAIAPLADDVFNFAPTSSAAAVAHESTATADCYHGRRFPAAGAYEAAAATHYAGRSRRALPPSCTRGRGAVPVAASRNIAPGGRRRAPSRYRRRPRRRRFYSLYADTIDGDVILGGQTSRFVSRRRHRESRGAARFGLISRRAPPPPSRKATLSFPPPFIDDDTCIFGRCLTRHTAYRRAIKFS